MVTLSYTLKAQTKNCSIGVLKIEYNILFLSWSCPSLTMDLPLEVQEAIIIYASSDNDFFLRLDTLRSLCCTCKTFHTLIERYISKAKRTVFKVFKSLRIAATEGDLKSVDSRHLFILTVYHPLKLEPLETEWKRRITAIFEGQRYAYDAAKIIRKEFEGVYEHLFEDDRLHTQYVRWTMYLGPDYAREKLQERFCPSNFLHQRYLKSNMKTRYVTS